jgi:hypothetical protein
MRRKSTAATVAAIVALGVGAASAQAREFEGTVTAKNKQARTFTLKQDEGGGTFKIKVNDSTRFERLSGFGEIRKGAKNIDVTARKGANGGWIAVEVERSGKVGGGGGGDDDPPGDDNGGNRG